MIFMIKVLDEYKSEQLISKYLTTVQSTKLSVDKLLSFDYNYPIYVKIMSDKAIHKVKSGAIFKIQDYFALKRQFTLIKKRFKSLNGKYIIVQPEIKGEEFIIGIRNDKKFGYLIMLGIGGKHAEALKDVSFRKLPITRKDANEMIIDLKNQAIVANINKNLLINSLLKIQNIIKSHKIETLDINPIKIDKNAIVIDGRIYLG